MQEINNVRSVDRIRATYPFTHSDAEGISAALHASPEPVSDVVLGDGVRYVLGEPPRTLLEVFPSGPTAPIVRITGENMQLSLFRQDQPPRVGPEGLVFERSSDGQRQLSLSATGELTLVFAPDASQTAQDAPYSRKGSETPSRSETSRTADSVASQTAFQRALPEDRQTKQPRVTYSGRLGADPRCRTTPPPKEMPVCTFPVAVKREGLEKPEWRRTVAFRDLAKRVRETLKKGMFVEVIGYEHAKTRKARDGTTRHDTEVYAVAIKQR